MIDVRSGASVVPSYLPFARSNGLISYMVQNSLLSMRACVPFWAEVRIPRRGQTRSAG